MYISFFARGRRKRKACHIPLPFREWVGAFRIVRLHSSHPHAMSDDGHAAPRLCGRRWCADAATGVFRLTPASDAAAKRAQRDAVLAAVAAHLAHWEARAAAEGWVAPPRRGTAARPLCAYVFDDFLDDVTFTAELVVRFGARVRVFSPNLKPAVVAALRATLGAAPGQVVADWACYEAFNAAHADAIRGAGGLDRLPSEAEREGSVGTSL